MATKKSPIISFYAKQHCIIWHQLVWKKIRKKIDMSGLKYYFSCYNYRSLCIQWTDIQTRTEMEGRLSIWMWMFRWIYRKIQMYWSVSGKYRNKFAKIRTHILNFNSIICRHHFSEIVIFHFCPRIPKNELI